MDHVVHLSMDHVGHLSLDHVGHLSMGKVRLPTDGREPSRTLLLLCVRDRSGVCVHIVVGFRF